MSKANIFKRLTGFNKDNEIKTRKPLENDSIEEKINDAFDVFLKKCQSIDYLDENAWIKQLENYPSAIHLEKINQSPIQRKIQECNFKIFLWF